MSATVNWKIQREYTELGIHWSISLPGTDLAWEPETLWGDESQIVHELICNKAYEILGELRDGDIRIDSILEQDGCVHVWHYVPNGARVCPEQEQIPREDSRATLRLLLANAVSHKSKTDG